MTDRHGSSELVETIDKLVRRSAAAVVAHARVANTALNAVLLRRLATQPGTAESMLADPVFETARVWATADQSLGDLSGTLLHPDLVTALDCAGEHAMPRTLKPYAHQIEAWRASLEHDQSVLVTSGTGSGKTECFLIPVLDDLLRHPRRGGGVQAILLYPLNALIESQRERLSAWAEGLGGRVRFALYNGETPETRRQNGRALSPAEVGDRRSIRVCPPEILVTNVAMLEYLLLRAQDRAILEASAGALRWIVLDEAHSYVGSQAAEMALLLRRVRAAFGVTSQQVTLMATSATIGGEVDAQGKLRAFLAALAGQPEDAARVIEGRAVEPDMPQPGADTPIDATALAGLGADALWDRLAPHPRVQTLRREMSAGAIGLGDVARIIFGDPALRNAAQSVLDAGAMAERDGHRLLPWRAHLFHRAQGGLWACINPGCAARDPELSAEDSGWGYGGISLLPRSRCACGAPVFEVVSCTECGTPHLVAALRGGPQPRLEALVREESDDFAVDAEPNEEGAAPDDVGQVWLAPANGAADEAWVVVETGRIFDNVPPAGAKSVRIRLIHDVTLRGCCGGARDSRVAPLWFGPAFFMGNGLPLLLEDLAQPLDQPGLPAGGRRAISFSDSRQGVARLAAKLQQEAERTLTRAFLWHAVQDQGDTREIPQKIAELKRDLERYRKFANDFEDKIEEVEAELTRLRSGPTRPVPWTELVRRFSGQDELKNFAGDVWRPRRLVGVEIGDNPAFLAEMFLYRELFRRPRIQNNPETLGLLRLSFPALEQRAAAMAVPRPLGEAGVDHSGWMGLALAAVDFVFRNNLAVDVPDWMVPLISPRFGNLNGVVPHGTLAEDRPKNAKQWPGPKPGPLPTRLHRLVYGLIGGDSECRIDQDRAGEVLSALWSLITSTAARDVGKGVWRLDFSRAAVVQLDRAFLCPITRRPFGYAIAGNSPYDVSRAMEEIAFPRLPHANAGGLDSNRRQEVAHWCETSPDVAELRRRGLWTNPHDRIAVYPPFLRAQEHSAQIPRAVLKTYEESFREGRINLLNCSTTMEMGVDIPQVQLVVNANVPPSVSNYRQRVGRAGRRGEPWAFGVTFCRDLPIDWQTFTDPATFLARPIAAPKVWLDSRRQVERHVNAALLASWLAERGGLDVRASVGGFLGAGDTMAQEVLPDAPADLFIDDLRGSWGASDQRITLLQGLLAGTALEGETVAVLCAVAAVALERLVTRWRTEHRALLDRQEAADDKDVRDAFALRAKRLRGEFLLSELARRGFTPAYGFPTDVVNFDHLKGRRDDAEAGAIIFGDRRGGASRSLDIAIREYAPGAEVVVDGLVHLSEGIRPAWGADADASKLEDFREFWLCPTCAAFGLDSLAPHSCPHCGAPLGGPRKVLRPVGFLGRRQPHTGYECLAHLPYDAPLLSAAGAPWIALPDPTAGRLRADAEGQVVVMASGAAGGGYAVCLECGKAEPMPTGDGRTETPLPEAIRRHRPLARGRGTEMTRDGFCPGGYTKPHRVQRHVHLVHACRTDVFELQLPDHAKPEAALALAAGLREALAERLGVEAREIGLATGSSAGPAGGRRVSIFLHDRAAGGAGLVGRLADGEMFAAALKRAAAVLDCPQGCVAGCPACVLRPDLNLRDLGLDRSGGLALGTWLSERLALPERLRVLGPDTRLMGRPVVDWIEDRRRAGQLQALEIFLSAAPEDWDFDGWPLLRILPRLADAKVPVRLGIPRAAMTMAGFDLAVRLSLHRLAGTCDLAMIERAPIIGGLPLLALIDGKAGSAAIVASDVSEAAPGGDWGAGAAGPVLTGPSPGPVEAKALSAMTLMEIGTGNARVLWLGSSLDGALVEFGNRFWRCLAQQAPLEIAAMQAVGVAKIQYSDRYLLTPLALGLLAEVITNAQGAAGATVTVALAPADRGEPAGWAVFHGFPADALRRKVLEALLPDARVTLSARKMDLHHYRALEITLRDGRCLRLLIDQGFGAWRAGGAPRHDFQARPEDQARSLRQVGIRVSTEDATPVSVEFQS